VYGHCVHLRRSSIERATGSTALKDQGGDDLVLPRAAPLDAAIVPIPLRTARLVLRYLTPADAEAFFAYRSEPAVALMQGWMPGSRAEADVFVGSVAGVPFARRGMWSQLGIVEAGNDALIGDVGAHVDASGVVAEIGYTIAPAFQRRGYATEAVRAILAELEAAYGIRCFTARTDPRNVASITLLTRLGFGEERRIGDDRHFRLTV